MLQLQTSNRKKPQGGGGHTLHFQYPLTVSMFICDGSTAVSLMSCATLWNTRSYPLTTADWATHLVTCHFGLNSDEAHKTPDRTKPMQLLKNIHARFVFSIALLGVNGVRKR